jgi:hypothetical protein
MTNRFITYTPKNTGFIIAKNFRYYHRQARNYCLIEIQPVVSEVESALCGKHFFRSVGVVRVNHYQHMVLTVTYHRGAGKTVNFSFRHSLQSPRGSPYLVITTEDKTSGNFCLYSGTLRKSFKYLLVLGAQIDFAFSPSYGESRNAKQVNVGRCRLTEEFVQTSRFVLDIDGIDSYSFNSHFYPLSLSNAVLLTTNLQRKFSLSTQKQGIFGDTAAPH